MANEGKRKGSRGSYKVGYGKPPKDTRFKPGQSGNRKGRPKGTKNFATDVRTTLSSPVRVTRDGSPRKISTQAAMLLRLRKKALGGDVRSLDRLIGLAQIYNNEELAETVNLSADDAEILELRVNQCPGPAVQISQLISADPAQQLHRRSRAFPQPRCLTPRAGNLQGKSKLVRDINRQINSLVRLERAHHQIPGLARSCLIDRKELRAHRWVDNH